MPFLQVTLDIGSSDPAPFEDALAGLDAVAVTLEDAADDPVLEPAPGATPLWPTVRLRALFDASADGRAVVSHIAARFPGLPPPQLVTIEDKAWEREWLKDFRPMRFGRRLWVCPGGQPAGDADAVRIELDPGLAFGTGTHPTTALCLEWLDARDLHGCAVVDYGCGSGILAIAALKLGAASVRAIDIDPQALIATRDNAFRNGVHAGLAVTSEPGLPPGSVDILVANILAGPLAELAPRFGAAVRVGGELALSGVLTSQVDAVTAAYRPWFDIAFTATREGWGLIGGRRRAA
ncbi:MAG TPA: 50S ribosomal protein L11 methyltransferase [Steroidobacteraceae bacterium]|nr:50S ribosomal protein L11 methyltransferase [Steroidobacteraceae bacterium]HQR49342.1 50S ribosomal protein L11 methyltransferase [Steroidobacteraceae bacterium]